MLTSIYDITNSTSSSSTSTSTTDSSSATTGLGQEAFLEMFMAQVTNQNPLDPMDNTDFTAQLATFSQLEQLTIIADRLENLEGMKESVEESTAINYIGSEVTMSGDVLPVTEGYVGEVGYTLESDAAEVVVTITDEVGSIVAQYDLGSVEAGTQTFQWEGTDSDGDSVSDGIYQVTIAAYDSSGNALTVSDQTASGLVTGYQQDADGVKYLLLGEAALEVSEVISVKMPTYYYTSTASASEDIAASASSSLASTASSSSSDDDDENEFLNFLKNLASVGSLAAALL